MLNKQFYFAEFKEQDLKVWGDDVLAFINELVYFIITTLDGVLRELEKDAG